MELRKRLILAGPKIRAAENSCGMVKEVGVAPEARLVVRASSKTTEISPLFMEQAECRRRVQRGLRW